MFDIVWTIEPGRRGSSFHDARNSATDAGSTDGPADVGMSGSDDGGTGGSAYGGSACSADGRVRADSPAGRGADTAAAGVPRPAPGARTALACAAAAAAPALLTPAELLDVCEDAERQIRWAQAVRVRMLSEFAARHPADTPTTRPGADPAQAMPSRRWVADEVGLALGISRHDATGQIAMAERFTTVLPDTLAALEAGEICWRRADALVSMTAVLPAHKARQVEARVLPKAADAHPKLMRDRIRRAIAHVDPDGEYRRHKEAEKGRRVSPRSLEDGMASLWCYGSAEQIEAAWTMVDRLARSLGTADPRTLDQRRFDLTVQILQGRITVTDSTTVDESLTSVLAAAWAAAQNGTAPDSADDGDGSARDAGDEIRATDNGATHSCATDNGVGPPSASPTGADHTATDQAATDQDATVQDVPGTGAVDPNAPAVGAAGHQGAAADDHRSDNTQGQASNGRSSNCGAADEHRDRDRSGHGHNAEASPADGAATPASSAPTRLPDGHPLADPEQASPTRPPTPTTAPRVPPDVLTEALAHVLTGRPDLNAIVRRPLLQVVVSLDTLLGSNRPAELIGHGPIDADTARRIAADSTIHRLITDPQSGNLLDHGRDTYTPPAALADHVRARDQICRGPRCTRRIRDLDHHIQYGAGHGGATSEANLNGYCLHCHLLKDVPGWQVIPHPTDGSITWISPCGRHTVSHPFDYRDFTDDLSWDGLGPPSQRPAATTEDAGPVTAENDDEAPPF